MQSNSAMIDTNDSDGSVNLTIVIPAYNEERRIGSTLEAYAEFFSAIYGNSYIILVVLNGCVDGTEDKVEELRAVYPQINHVVFQNKLGKGGAVIEGLKLAMGNVVCFVDADNMVEPPETVKLVDAIKTTDVAIGNRWHEASRSRSHRPLQRRILSLVVRLLVKYMLRLNYVDTQCGAKAIRGDALKLIVRDLSEKGWTFDLDFLVNANRYGLSVKEIPVQWRHVELDSKVRIFRDLPRDLVSGIRIWFKRYSRVKTTHV